MKEKFTDIYVSKDNLSITNVDELIDAISKIAGKSESIKIYFKAGDYHFDKCLEITDELLNGSALELLSDGEVFVKGSTVIKTGVWEKYNNNIMSTQLEKGLDFDVLFVNGNEQVMARYPNYTEGEILGGYCADSISPERASRWEHPETGYIRAIHSHEWGGNSYRITGKDKNNNLTYEWVGDHNQGSGMHKERRMAENIFEELDAQNEWFYNKDTGVLYFYPTADIDLEKSIFEVAVLDDIIRITNSTSNIHISGITFTQSHRTLFNSIYERPLRSDWGLVRKGAIYIENSENITIDNCKFDYLGGNGIMMSGYNKNHTVNYCDFTNLGASGILVVGLQSATRDPSTWDNENHKTTISDFEAGPKTEEYGRDITISNNYIRNIGTIEKQTAGVYISICKHITITKNTVHHVPRSAITIGDGTFGGHIISHNDMFETVLETGDHGPFNSWGRDRFWSFGNYVHDFSNGEIKYPYALLDAIEQTQIYHNRIHGKRGFGIDLDDGSTNYLISNNLCLGLGIKCREGFYRIVENNILIGAPLDIHCIYAQNSDIYRKNIIYNKLGIKYCGGMSDAQTTVYENMTYWNNGEDVGSVAGGTTDIDPQFENPIKNNYTVTNKAVLNTGFVNFPMDNDSFGRSDAPNPPIFEYAKTDIAVKTYKLAGAIFKNVTDSERSSCATPDYDGVYIESFYDESAFVVLGEKTIIRDLDGKKIKNYDDFAKIYGKLEKGRIVVACVYLQGKEEQIQFVI